MPVEHVKQTCDACGQAVEVMGILFNFYWATDEDKKRLERSMAPYEAREDYRVCYSCILKAMGIKPPVKEIECPISNQI